MALGNENNGHMNGRGFKYKNELGKIMHEKSIKPAKLAALTGCSESYVSQLLSGKQTNISLNIAFAIADALDSTVDACFRDLVVFKKVTKPRKGEDGLTFEQRIQKFSAKLPIKSADKKE